MDAYPLFVANAAGCVLISYFGYRKMFKHQDNRWQTGTVLSPSADGSWDEDYVVNNAADWLRWMLQFEDKMAWANQLVHATSNWTSTTDKQHVEFQWDRSEISAAPNNNNTFYKDRIRLPIEPSYLQKMVAMEEVDSDSYMEIAKEELEKLTPKKLDLSQDDEAEVLNLLGKHADIFDLEYQIATAHSDVSVTSNVKSFVTKLKSFSNDTTYTEGALQELCTPMDAVAKAFAKQ